MAWGYVKPGTEVIGSDGRRIGTLKEMLGTEDEGIFRGAAVDPEGGGATRFVPADDVRLMTPARVEVSLDSEGLDAAAEHRPPPEV